MGTLEEVLSGDEPQEEVVDESEKEPVEEAVEDESTEDEEIVEEKDEEPKGVTAEPPSAKEVPLTALLDERDKRKQLQTELEDLKTEKSEQKDVWADPEGYIDEKLNTRVGALEQQYQSGYLSLSMNMSKMYHEDFDAAKEAFIKAAEENPALAEMAVQSELPGEYIYKAGKEYLLLEQSGGNIETAIERAKREAVEEYVAKQSEKDDSKKQNLAAVPKPLTDETSASAPRETVEGGSTSLDNILKHNRG